jgi:pyruvate dehydrogenase E1 component alpha subunit
MGPCILRVAEVTGVMGELLGRQIGMSNGKGGSMHIFTPRFFGGNGIVGAQVPVGAGIAFAMKYLGKPSATFALYPFPETSSLWQRPCLVHLLLSI